MAKCRQIDEIQHIDAKYAETFKKALTRFNQTDKISNNESSLDGKCPRCEHENSAEIVNSLLEYIPEERLQNIETRCVDGFSTIYTAKWIGGEIESIDFIKSSIKRKGPQLVVLKTIPQEPKEEDAHSLIARGYCKLPWHTRLLHLLSLSRKLVIIHHEGIIHGDWQWPEIPKHTPAAFAELITRCWDPNPDKRLNAHEVFINIGRLFYVTIDYYSNLFVDKGEFKLPSKDKFVEYFTKLEIAEYDEVLEFFKDDWFRMTRPSPEKIPE
ncbi:1305_t:CDS:2, partial [Cetraspora pellucida]